MLKLKKFLPKKDASFLKKVLFWFITIGVSVTLLGMIILGGLIVTLAFTLPDVNDLENLTADQSTQIFDREGNPIYTIHGDENREVVDLTDISENLINATIALEDDQFYTHPGFDVWAIGRAGMYEVFGIGSPRGGSTLTQQYVKNTFLSTERSYIRKIKELVLSMRLEKARTKDEILALYLNRIPYGNNAYGIQKASQVYFGKDASDLTIAESAVLAALPQAPSRYNPYGNNLYSHLQKEFTIEELDKRDLETELDLEFTEYTRGLIGQHIALQDGTILYLTGRTDHVLKRMEEEEKITTSQRQKALNELKNLEFKKYGQSLDHPHFVFYIKDQLEERYGKDVVERGGLKVYTTLDTDLQKYAEQVSKEIGETNETKYQANNNAILTVEAKTGQILAMVGSRDYNNDEIDGKNNIILSSNSTQPGSSFKPFVFAQAFYNGYAPSSVVYDVPTNFGSYKPKNYDGSWSGKMTIREALGKSKNIPAVKAYFLAGTQEPLISFVEKIGITTLDRNKEYGAQMALGGVEASLMEMVTAYSTFANNGKKPEIVGILRVENNNGDVLEEWQPKEFEEVIAPQIAYLINDILSDQSVAVGPRLFVSGQKNAAKTGTSTKESSAGNSQIRPKDAWTIGYTPSIVTGVWAGNTQGHGMGYNANGYDTAGPIFQKVMAKALEGKSAEPFPQPKGIKQVKISKASGKLPNDNTPEDQITTGLFASFAVPTQKEKVFQSIEIDKISGLLATKYTPEEARKTVTYQNLEPIADKFNWRNEIYAYYKNRQPDLTEITSEEVILGAPPTEKSTTHSPSTEAKKPSINITSPVSQSIVAPGNLTVNVDIKAPHKVQMVEYYVDGDRKFFTDSAPYTGSVNISRFLEDNSRHLIKARIIDQLGYSSESVIEIKIDRQANNEDLNNQEEEDDDDEEEQESNSVLDASTRLDPLILP